MGLSFDGNGRYVGWSNLFNYSTVKTIKASEALPMPKKRIYKKTADGVNIDSFIEKIVNIRLLLEKIGVNGDFKEIERLLVSLTIAYAEVINFLNKNSRFITRAEYAKLLNNPAPEEKDAEKLYFTVNYTHEFGDLLMKLIANHEFTDIPYSLLEDASKNFISSHILNTVLNLRNMIGAYSPIEMEDFRAASENSPKGEQSSKMTLWNPATKLLMQYLNITGKNVIGIAANGEKASFMWHYYLNDIILKTNIDSEFFLILFDLVIDNFNKTSPIIYEHINVIKYISDSVYRDGVLKNYTEITELLKPLKDLEPYIKKIKRSQFNFTTTRLYGRSSGNIEVKEVGILPDVNFEGINLELVNLYGIQLTGNITIDLMISLILSAATDNAKELILAKVNAGTKLAKIYLFLVTLGYDINDIVAFMTSPAVNFIDIMTEPNIFTDLTMSVDTAISVAKGDFTPLYKNKLSSRTASMLWDNHPEYKDKLKKGDLSGIINDFKEGSAQYIEFLNILDTIADARNVLEECILNELNVRAKKAIESGKTFNEEEARNEIITSMSEDLDEFLNILEGANEFSNFGKILGLNQGLPTSKILLQKRVQDIQKILSDRIKKYNEANPNDKVDDTVIDVLKYLTDDNYREEIKNLYDKVKKCINIFEILDHIPLYNAILQIFSMVMESEHIISIKSRAYDSIYASLKEQGYNNISEEYQTRLLKGIDDAMIIKFVNESNIAIPYQAGTTLLTELEQEFLVPNDGLLQFNNLSDISSFKYYFENTIIPNLKEGLIPKYTNDGGLKKVILEYLLELKDNRFVRALIKGESLGMPLYKCDLDMLTAENTQDSKIRFLQYVKGLLLLSKYWVNGTKLSDLFVLYNLVVNKNQYGSDRLTTLFDSLILNNGHLSLIQKYLNFIGELDQNGKVEDLNLNLVDLMKRASIIVPTEIGQKDPSIIINTEDRGPVFKIKEDGVYKEKYDLIPIIEGESTDERLHRIYNYNSYFVLGGRMSDFIDRLVKNLRLINDNTINSLKALIRTGVLRIYKVCQ